MKIITKEEYLEKVSKIHAGSFTKMKWICDRTIIGTNADGTDKVVSAVCTGMVRVKVNYAKMKAAKAAKEARVLAIMSETGFEREKAEEEYENTKREVWFDRGETGIVYHKSDLSHMKPYVQVYKADAKDISDYTKHKVVKNRIVSVKYICNFGTDLEEEISEADVLKALSEKEGTKFEAAIKKHVSPGSTWIKALSDVIDIGF